MKSTRSVSQTVMSSATAQIPPNPLQKQKAKIICSKDFDKSRAEITRDILSIVQGISAGSPCISPTKARALAERLEMVLFWSAPSFDAYADKNTMKKRISLIGQNVLKSKERQALVYCKNGRKLCSMQSNASIFNAKVSKKGSSSSR